MQAVATAARLEIPDVLAGGARTAEEVAAKTGADAGAMYRLLRALASLGVLERSSDGRFANTAIGDRLRIGAPGGAEGHVHRGDRPRALAVLGARRRRREDGAAPAEGGLRRARVRVLRPARRRRRAVRPRDAERLEFRGGRGPRGLRLLGRPHDHGRRWRQRQHGAGHPREVSRHEGEGRRPALHRAAGEADHPGGGRRRPLRVRGRRFFPGRAEGRGPARPQVHPARLDRRGVRPDPHAAAARRWRPEGRSCSSRCSCRKRSGRISSC